MWYFFLPVILVFASMNWYGEQFRYFSEASTRYKIVLALWACSLASISEEIFYRHGLIFFLNYYDIPYPVYVSSVLFGIAHVTNYKGSHVSFITILVHIIGCAIYGYGLCQLNTITEQIYWHILLNGSQMLILFLRFYLESKSESKSSNEEPIHILYYKPTTYHDDFHLNLKCGASSFRKGPALHFSSSNLDDVQERLQITPDMISRFINLSNITSKRSVKIMKIIEMFDNI